MKIERDKWYVMRNGEKVRVVCVDAPGEYPVVAVGSGDGVTTHTADGFGVVGVKEHPHDLISERREPARVWVNMYRDGSHTAYDHEAEAHGYAGPRATRIAVEFVEVVNGRDDG